MIAFDMQFKLKFLMCILIALIYQIVIADTIFLNNGGKINCQKIEEKESNYICYYEKSQIIVSKAAVKEIISNDNSKLYKNPETSIKSNNTSYIESQEKKSVNESAGSLQGDALIKEIEIKKLESNYNLKKTSDAKLKLINGYIEAVNELFDNKNFKKALEYLLKLEQLKPNDESINTRIAFCYYKISDFFMAIYYAQKTKKINDKYADAYFLLGDIYYLQGNLNDALYEWQEGLKLQSNIFYEEKLKKLKEEMKISQDFYKTNSSHFKIEFDGEALNPSITNNIINELEEIYKELTTTLNYYPKEPIAVIFYTNKDYKIIRKGPDWSSGVYDGKIRIPAKGINFNEYLIPLLKHEFTHAIVSQKTNNNAPAWLQEGLAEYFEGEKLNESKDFLKLPKIEYLTGSFSSLDSQQARLAYGKSLSFINFLIEQYGIWKILMFLDKLSDENNVPKAFFYTYSEELEKIEKAWENNLIKR